MQDQSPSNSRFFGMELCSENIFPRNEAWVLNTVFACSSNPFPVCGWIVGVHIVDPSIVRETINKFILPFNLEKIPSDLWDLYSGR